MYRHVKTSLRQWTLHDHPDFQSLTPERFFITKNNGEAKLIILNYVLMLLFHLILFCRRDEVAPQKFEAAILSDWDLGGLRKAYWSTLSVSA